jgi:outer membrane protein OmpA-like peptidoglycan-associated protein
MSARATEMKQIRAKFILVSAGALGLAGCAMLGHEKPRVESRPNSAAPISIEPRKVEVAQRALPTRNENTSQPAHYQHVYIDPRDDKSRSVQTISLDDAIKSQVLASSEFEVKTLDTVNSNSLQWIVLERGFSRPSELEGVGGSSVKTSTFADVFFGVGQSDVTDQDTVKTLSKIASRLDGVFHVVGYTDETGAEVKNKALSLARALAVKNLLVTGGVNPDRIDVVGAGVSRTFPTLEANRRASISFRVLTK